MVSQSSYGSIRWFLNHHMVPLYGFSIIIWYPKIWFLNQNLVNYMFPNQTSAFSRYSATDSASKEQEQMLVSRPWFSERGFPKYGFSIIVWFHYMVSQSSYGSIIWFLNQKMVSQNMVSQSKTGFPKYGFSIKKW